MNDIINWKRRFMELLNMVDLATYDKAMHFEEKGDKWYSRIACDELSYGQMMDEVNQLLKEVCA